MKLRCLIIAGLTFWLAACGASGLAVVNSPLVLDGDYTVSEAAYGPHPLHKLDIYVPGDSRNRPQDVPKDVIVFFHGGRWQSGQKEDYRFVAARLAQEGFITVIPDFRKYPEARFPVFVEDGAKALAWVSDHIAEYGGRQNAIHLAGHSSGAHMAALLAADERYLQAENKDPGLIQDFAGLAGPYAFTPEDDDLVAIFGPPERYDLMRATTFINGDEPPMLLLYGEDDNTVAPYNHQRLARRIKEEGGRVDVITYPGLGHIGIIATFSGLGPDSPVVDDMVGFFNGSGS